MTLFKRNRKDHWERVYQKLSSTEVGWYQAFPERSLKLISNTCVGTDCRIIDVGGGTSKLSEHLLGQGYIKLTVLDISGKSINKAKSQLGRIFFGKSCDAFRCNTKFYILPVHQAYMRKSTSAI